MIARGLTDDASRWLALAQNALDQFPTWSDGALLTAHTRRSQNTYRGPDRWLQLTFDCLGKLAWAAELFASVERDTTGEPAGAFTSRDEVVRFEPDRHVAVWTYRSSAIAFVLPFVGPAWADYLPAPRNPGLYEVPVDAPLPSFVPTITADGDRFVAGGVPTELTHQSGHMSAWWEGFPPITPGSPPKALPGRRTAHARVDGHVLRVHEILDFVEVPQSISLQVTETRHRPLRFDVETDSRHRIDVIDTDGIALYRSFWSELPRVHQVDVEPASHTEFTWSVRPLVRIATADPSHHYHRSLYDPIAADVVETSFGGHLVHRLEAARARLATVDAVHLHWPEWFLDTPEEADTFIEPFGGDRHHVGVDTTQPPPAPGSGTGRGVVPTVRVGGASRDPPQPVGP